MKKYFTFFILLVLLISCSEKNHDFSKNVKNKKKLVAKRNNDLQSFRRPHRFPIGFWPSDQPQIAINPSNPKDLEALNLIVNGGFTMIHVWINSAKDVYKAIKWAKVNNIQLILQNSRIKTPSNRDSAKESCFYLFNSGFPDSNYNGIPDYIEDNCHNPVKLRTTHESDLSDYFDYMVHVDDDDQTSDMISMIEKDSEEILFGFLVADEPDPQYFGPTSQYVKLTYEKILAYQNKKRLNIIVNNTSWLEDGDFYNEWDIDYSEDLFIDSDFIWGKDNSEYNPTTFRERNLLPLLNNHSHYISFGIYTQQDISNQEDGKRKFFNSLYKYGQWCRENNKQLWNIIVTSDHSIGDMNYQINSEHDIRWQFNSSIAYGSKGIYYYTLFSKSDDAFDSPVEITRNQDELITDVLPYSKYTYIRNVNKSFLRKYGDLFLKLTLNQVYQVNMNQVDDKKYFTPLLTNPEDLFGVESFMLQNLFVKNEHGNEINNHPLIISRFLDESTDAQYFMIVNNCTKTQIICKTSLMIYPNKDVFIIEKDGSLIKKCFSLNQNKVISIDSTIIPGGEVVYKIDNSNYAMNLHFKIN